MLDDIFNKLTFEEKLYLLVGYASMETNGIERLGIERKKWRTVLTV